MSDRAGRSTRREALAAYKSRERRHSWEILGLSASQLADLHSVLEKKLTGGCSHLLVESRAWSEHNDVPWPELNRGLRALGGFCDCEVLANIEPDSVI